mmetsp:Transcript_119420/g.380883  ORF Transcript_119420/g.380883 Transcript_119420/m.380883 type:complete len:265 (-) Transcript_119420:1845-2639(-)
MWSDRLCLQSGPLAPVPAAPLHSHLPTEPAANSKRAVSRNTQRSTARCRRGNKDLHKPSHTQPSPHARRHPCGVSPRHRSAGPVRHKRKNNFPQPLGLQPVSQSCPLRCCSVARHGPSPWRRAWLSNLHDSEQTSTGQRCQSTLCFHQDRARGCGPLPGANINGPGASPSHVCDPSLPCKLPAPTPSFRREHPRPTEHHPSKSHLHHCRRPGQEKRVASARHSAERPPHQRAFPARKPKPADPGVKHNNPAPAQEPFAPSGGQK